MVKNSIRIFINKILNIVFALVFGVVISRVLGPADRGELALILLPMLMLSLFFRGGVDIANIHFIKGGKNDVGTILFTSTIVGIILSIIAVSLYFIFQDYLPVAIFGKSNSSYVWLTLSIVPLEILGTFFSFIILGLDRIKDFNNLNLLTPICNTLFLAVLYFLIGPINLEGVIYIYVLTYILRFFVGWYYISRIVKTPKKWDLKLAKGLLAYGMKGHIGNVFDFFIMRMDLMLIGYFMSTEAVGLYTVAMVSEKILIIPDSISLSVLSGIQQNEQGVGSSKACRVSVALTFMTCVAAVIVTPFVIPLLFGKAYSGATSSFMILVVAYFFQSITKPLKSYIYIKMNKPELTTWTSLITLGMNLVLNFILIPHLGIEGAAIATMLSNLAYAIGILFFYLKDSKQGLINTLILRNEDFNLLISKIRRLKV